MEANKIDLAPEQAKSGADAGIPERRPSPEASKEGLLVGRDHGRRVAKPSNPLRPSEQMQCSILEFMSNVFQ